MNASPEQAKEIFVELIGNAPPEQWDERLAQVCGDDDNLRRRVQALLRAHREPDSFLEQPAIARDVEATTAQPLERPGTQIGPYKLLQQIGEGGMGVVYMAEQTEPIARRVALKIIKPGMDSHQVVARFEAERHALALMDHVNIARVLDAGTTPAGRPYFVMELVHGVPITKYCDDNHLTPRQRLELLMPVCQAIQHAHQKGIIHRDIKPSNVMVTLYDGQPVPKVIDFGVAKATEQKLTERTLFTQYGTMVGTLEYMSPEQAEMSALGVDTRSDIYSLGVLLYELLTGSTPLSSKMMKEAAYAEILRMIKEEEPPKPSTRLSDSGEALVSISAQRHTEPAKLTKLVRGELDWIVMKCLEKDRNRRYETVNGFAADVQRYLKDEPVQACPPSAGYRLRKFARRNKRTLLTATMLGLMLLAAVGTVAGTLGWAARDRAERQAVFDQEVNKALQQGEAWFRRDNPTEALAAVRQAEGLLASGQSSEELQQRVRRWRTDLEMATRLEEIRLQQSDMKGESFDFAGADAAYAAAFRDYGIDVSALEVAAAEARIRASAIREQLTAALDDWAYIKTPIPSWATIEQNAAREQLLAIARLADPDDWRNRFRALILPSNRRALEELADRPEVASLPAATVVLLGRALSRLNKSAKALAILHEGLQRHPDDFWLNYHLARMYASSAPPRVPEAVGFYRAARALRPQSPQVHVNLATLLANQGKVDEAIGFLHQAIQLKPDYVLGHTTLGWALARKGAWKDAVAAYDKALALKPNDVGALCGLANTYRNKGDLDEAVQVCQKAIPLIPQAGFFGSSSDGRVYYELGLTFAAKKNWDEAIACYWQAIRLAPDNISGARDLGLALRAKGSLDDSLAAFVEDVARKPDDANALTALAVALRQQSELTAARRLFGQALGYQRAALKSNPQNPRYRRWLHDDCWGLAETLVLLGEHAAAAESAAELPRLCADDGLAHSYFRAASYLSRCVPLVEKDARLSERDRRQQAQDYADRAVSLLEQSLNTEGGDTVNLGQPAFDSVRSRQDFQVLNWKAAIATLEKSVQLSSAGDASARAHNELAWILATCPEAKFRDTVRAVELAKKAVELSPTNGDIWHTLGVAHYRAGDWKAAVAGLEKSMELRQGGDSFEWFFLAMAHWQLGEKDKARQWYDQAVQWMDKNSPNDEELRRFRAETAELLAQLEASQEKDKK